MPAILKKGTSLGQSAVAMLLRRYSKKQAKPQLIAINRELSLSLLSLKPRKCIAIICKKD